MGLRERKKLDTRRMLSDAALALAFERGMDNVTRDEIAARAGVSLRTFSNYFTTKYDALAYRQTERVRASLAILRARPADEPLWDAIVASVLAPLEQEIAAEAVPTRAQLDDLRKLVSAPEARMSVSTAIGSDWIEAIADRTGMDPVTDMYPRLAVGVIVAVLEAAAAAYVDSDPPQHITVFLRKGFADVRDGMKPPRTKNRRRNP